MITKLKNLNPNIPFFTITDNEFKTYGRVIDGLDTSEIISVANTIKNPDNGSSYVPSEPLFEELAIANEIERTLFGALPAQIGYCWGHNDMLNATEWHTSSEINIAVTDLVLLLAHRYDITDNRIDSVDFKAFFVPQGTVIEVYATSLHFCPCEVEKSGFGCVVGLPSDTNTPLNIPSTDPLLFRKNKWLLAHEKNEQLISRGVVAGISGENYKIKY